MNTPVTPKAAELGAPALSQHKPKEPPEWTKGLDVYRQEEGRREEMRTAEQWDFGHPIYCSDGPRCIGGKWFYCDNDVSLYAEKRACPECHQARTVDGHDPCIADLADVSSACCGHGLREITPYLVFSRGGHRIIDRAALEYFRNIGKGPP